MRFTIVCERGFMTVFWGFPASRWASVAPRGHLGYRVSVYRDFRFNV